MKLSKLYSNFPSIMGAVHFRDGLNVVLGSVRRPKNRAKDTHNLGKTLLAQVIDFCLLKEKSAEFFLFKREVFRDFIFFLEIRLPSGPMLTIRRSVKDGSKASFKTHAEPHQDYSASGESVWDHWMVPFSRSKDLLEGLLDLEVLKPWSFRHAVSYALRTQKDFDEPFKLSKYGGKHADWKPVLATILGLNGSLVARGYELDERAASLKTEETRLRAENRGLETPDQLRGQIEIAERDVAALSSELDRFDLAPAERRITTSLVEDLDKRIAEHNELRYDLLSAKQRIELSLEERFSLDLPSVEQIFRESKIYFGDQVKKDYGALERFNNALVVERDIYLKEELAETSRQIASVEGALAQLNAARISALATLSDTEAISKFKRLSKRLSEQQADLELVRRRFLSVEQLQNVRRTLRGVEHERSALHQQLEESVGTGTPVYADIRRHFDDIVYRVIGIHSNLYTQVNEKGHLDFRTELVDAEGRPTSASDGFTYGRLLCIAFDMAVLRTYASSRYPHFVYHDGALETLDDRKKLNLIDVVRDISSAGTQHIWTAIDSELPVFSDGTRFSFSEHEIILRLHDDGDNGRLFKMPSW